MINWVPGVVVPGTGLEPVSLAAADFKSAVYTNFTTRADAKGRIIAASRRAGQPERQTARLSGLGIDDPAGHLPLPIDDGGRRLGRVLTAALVAGDRCRGLGLQSQSGGQIGARHDGEHIAVADRFDAHGRLPPTRLPNCR